AGAAPGSCALGSVKSQIGHTKCAAGLAGLVKAAAALHAGVRPPTNLREPNPSWDPESSPFFFDQQARPWLAAPGDRFAGISAFAPAREATGRVAFLFPGQGSQRPGMLADLFVAFPRLQRHLRGDAAPYAAALFPPAAFGPDRQAAQRERITDTRVAQPVMGIAGTAVHELLEWLGVRADMAGGHSYGELVAPSAAGTIRTGDLLSLGEARAAAILGAAGAVPGTMAAVGADVAAVRDIL